MTARTAIVYDCEFLAVEGSPMRFWCGPMDPDPVIVQIGAAKLSLDGDFAIRETMRSYVKPIDRHGEPYTVDPFFTRLTGIDGATVAREGVSLGEALTALDTFADGAGFWSFGKDEFNMVAISCYVAGIPPPIPAERFANACTLLLKAGMPSEDLNRVRSNTLAGYYDLDTADLRGHDALDDALSVARALQHLLRRGDLSADDFG